MRIEVVNSRVISEYLGFEVKNLQDLMEDDRCQKFIEENKKYFVSTDPKDFIEFYNKTGIILEYYYNELYSFNMFGLKDNAFRIYACHLRVIDNDNIINVKEGILYINNKKVRNVREEIDNQKKLFLKFDKFNERLKEINNNPYFYDEFNKEKEHIIKHSLEEDELFFDYKALEDAKQVVVTPYYDVLSLMENGDLYHNKKMIERNVAYIFEQDLVNKAIVYNDNRVEYLIANFGGPYNKKCDKVVFDSKYLAILKDKRLEVIILKENEYINDTSQLITLDNVDDIDDDFDSDGFKVLTITIGENKLILSLLDCSIERGMK